MTEQVQIFLAALWRHCSSRKSDRKVFTFSGCKREAKTTKLLDNNKYLFFTVSVCSLWFRSITAFSISDLDPFPAWARVYAALWCKVLLFLCFISHHTVPWDLCVLCVWNAGLGWYLPLIVDFKEGISHPLLSVSVIMLFDWLGDYSGIDQWSSSCNILWQCGFTVSVIRYPDFKCVCGLIHWFAFIFLNHGIRFLLYMEGQFQNFALNFAQIPECTTYFTLNVMNTFVGF